MHFFALFIFRQLLVTIIWMARFDKLVHLVHNLPVDAITIQFSFHTRGNLSSGIASSTHASGNSFFLYTPILIFRRLYWSLMIIRIAIGCFIGETVYFRHVLKIKMWTFLLKTQITDWLYFLRCIFFSQTSST